jgi:hypothetical protein
LLAHVRDHPQVEKEIGVAWIDDETFRMHKHTLATVMEIKLNTLNVNLRDLQFRQQQHDKEGWTRWSKTGFTRNSFKPTEDGAIFDSAPTKRYSKSSAPQSATDYLKLGNSSPFQLGRCNRAMLDQFFTQTDSIWQDLSNRALAAVGSSTFIKRAAERFRQEGQPLQNAIDVLTAIITPRSETSIAFEQFARFMAMFGPEKTVMLKIAALLECSQKTGQWLYFNTDQLQFPVFYGAFDYSEPNCLVIHDHDRVSRIWNYPLSEANERFPYLTDESSRTYVSWSEYFEVHPPRPYYDMAYV